MFDTELIRRIRGFMDEEEGQMLYETALKASRMGPCLEIGSYCGKSAVYLGSACKENGAVLFSIDHHRGSEEQQPGEEYFDPELYDHETGQVDTFREFRRTIQKAKIEDAVIPVVAKSHIAAAAWGTPVSLVFIDGGHSLETAFTDYSAWAGHVMPGGWLLIHDVFKDPSEGGQAPHEIYKRALASGLFYEETMIKTLAVLRRWRCGEMPTHEKKGGVKK